MCGRLLGATDSASSDDCLLPEADKIENKCAVDGEIRARLMLLRLLERRKQEEEKSALL